MILLIFFGWRSDLGHIVLVLHCIVGKCCNSICCMKAIHGNLCRPLYVNLLNPPAALSRPSNPLVPDGQSSERCCVCRKARTWGFLWGGWPWSSTALRTDLRLTPGMQRVGPAALCGWRTEPETQTAEHSTVCDTASSRFDWSHLNMSSWSSPQGIYCWGSTQKLVYQQTNTK